MRLGPRPEGGKEIDTRSFIQVPALLDDPSVGQDEAVAETGVAGCGNDAIDGISFEDRIVMTVARPGDRESSIPLSIQCVTD